MRPEVAAYFARQTTGQLMLLADTMRDHRWSCVTVNQGQGRRVTVSLASILAELALREMTEEDSRWEDPAPPLT
jgi:hypothetical protein